MHTIYGEVLGRKYNTENGKLRKVARNTNKTGITMYRGTKEKCVISPMQSVVQTNRNIGDIHSLQLL